MTEKIRIGIPRALLYHKYHVFWKDFFRLLGCEVIVSPQTNKQIMAEGVNLAIDESCLSIKIYLGHIDYLKDRVDYVFIPRFVSFHRQEKLCVKFMALADVVENTFDKIKILSYSVDVENWQIELPGLLAAAWQVNHNPLAILRAYFKARRKQGEYKKKAFIRAVE
jgi:predicted nucleotide-binding protein (sugar kinase/HSP70/actin superfamily)